MNSIFKKYPALISVIPLITGILVSSSIKKDIISFDNINQIVIYITAGFACIVCYAFRNKSSIFIALYIFSLLLFGFSTFHIRQYHEQNNSVTSYLKDNSRSKIILKGVVAENPEIKTESIRLLLDDVVIDSAYTYGMVLASVYKNKFKESEPSDVNFGSTVEIEGTLEQLPHRRNPAEFDYGAYLKMHDIDAVFYTYGFDKIKITGTKKQNFYKSNIINPVRNYTIDIINKYIGGDEGEYLKGLILGERSNISKEIKEDFVNAGVAHIIAVSGLNVAYVLIIIWAILVFVPVSQNFKYILTILLLVFYMNLTGNTPSIIRATIMASVFLIAQIFERKTNIFNIISFSALLILVVDPRQLFDAGFILSYSAILSIVIIYPKINEWLNEINWYAGLNTKSITGKVLRLLSGLFFGTLAAQIGTLPITALMFKKVSIISLAANIFAIPLSNISLALGFMVVITSLISSWLTSAFASANILLIFVQLKAISFCANLDYAFVETYFVNFYFLAAYYLILLLLYTASAKNIIPRFVLVVLIAFNYFIYSSVAENISNAELTYIDVGNSSATLIKMPKGTNILLNCGSSTNNSYSAQRQILPYLKSNGVGSIDILVINSMNFNEYRNLVYFVNNFQVTKIILPIYYKSLFYNNKSFVNTRIEFADQSLIINKQGNFRIYIYYDKVSNDESMMTELVYGEQSFIFSDSYDVDSDAFNTLMLPDENALMILKASGSGSFDYNSADFIVKAEPEFVVISSSERGRKKAASDIFSKSLDESGYTVLRTGREGAIIFETDGYQTKRVAWK